mgnify:CR=1 FL=1
MSISRALYPTAQALELMKGMLKWHHEERMSIEEIIRSEFVADRRDERYEVGTCLINKTLLASLRNSV